MKKFNLTRKGVADGWELDEAMEAVNGRARTYTLHACDAIDFARICEERLAASGVPVRLRKGAKAIHVPAGPGATYARKGRYFVTGKIEIERGTRDWFLTSYTRVEAWSDQPEKNTILVAREAREAIIARALEGFEPLPLEIEILTRVA